MTRRVALFIALLIVGAGLTADAQSTDRFEALVGLARVKRDAGDAPEARRYFEQARRMRPFDVALETEYFWILADVAPSDAAVAGRALLVRQPDADDVRERSIAAAVAVGDDTLALDLARAGAARDPQRALWHRRVAESHARRGKALDAAAAWDAALAARGADQADRAGLAMALEASGQAARALAVWGQVPDETRRLHEDWERSRLRALAQAGQAAAAAREIGAWLAVHANDTPMRESLVELWRRAGDPGRARMALQPLLDGPERRRWLRQDVDLARAAGDRRAAIDGLEQMVLRDEATRTDRLVLAEMLIEDTGFVRAGQVIGVIAGSTAGCDRILFGLIDRLPGETGTSLLINQLQERDCRQQPDWIVRGIDRATADGRHREALMLLRTLPEAARETDGMQRLAGQLHLWTGDAPAAARMLAPFVDGHPADEAARTALVDAYRAVGDPYAAWRVALPLVDGRDTSSSRLLTLAELAIEADQPHVVEGLLARVPAGDATPAVRIGLRGRALAALGRPADAVLVLSPAASDLPASAMLVLIDSVHATRGVDAALAIARQAETRAVDATDLLARRVMLETLAAASPGATTPSRAVLMARDPALPLFVEAEVALAQERPLDAMAVLSTLPADAQPQRAADLRVTALMGSGNLQAAADLLRSLRQQRPDFTPFVLREAELAWRLRPGDDTLRTVLALPARFPGNRHAMTVAARALAFEKRHLEVVDLFGGVAAVTHLPIEGRVLLSRSLAAAGRGDEALAVLAGLQLRGPASIFRAELVARVEGHEAGARAFRALAASPEASADLFLAWAALTPGNPERLEVLEAGVHRFVQHPALWASLAVARAAAGRREDGLAAAERAVALDTDSGEAWFQVIAGTAAARPAEQLDRVLKQFAAVAAGRPALSVATADRVASLVRSASDPLLVSALDWLRGDVADRSLEVSRDLAVVRLLAAGQRWFEALEAADRAVLSHPEAAAALRLRADVLSWAGRHDEGIAAYDDYLAVVPDDVDAGRQQARVAGWAGRFTDARRFYAALRARRPDDTAIAAEAQAKVAFFDGRWRRAVDRYEQWLLVEPGNSEARFEMAEALRAAGDVEQADAQLAALSPDGGHRLADAARQREVWRRDPSVALIVDLSSADGYDRQRLLEIRSSGARLQSVYGPTGRTTFSADAVSVQAASGTSTRSGYQLGGAAGQRVSRTTALDGQVSLWDVSGPGAPAVQAMGSAAWSPADRWTLRAGARRELLLDNITTIDRRLAATGAFVGAGFESPQASLGVESSWQRLSDGNARRRVSLTATRAISERLSSLRAIAWADVVDYARPAAGYFAPQRFLRVDGGLEFTHLFSQPRFRGDRMDQVAVGYLIGTDSRGTLYQHPSVRLGWEMTPTMTLSVRADAIRSHSYNERSVLVSLHLIGGAFSR